MSRNTAHNKKSVNVEALLIQANTVKDMGDLTKAKLLYQQIIQKSADCVAAWNNLGNCYQDEGRFGEAAERYKEAIRLLPDFADAHSNLGNCYKHTGQQKEAIMSYLKAIKVRPTFASAHSNLASCYMDMGLFPFAVKSYRKSLELGMRQPDICNNLGNALRMLKEIDESVKAYKLAIQYDPNYFHAWSNMGNSYKDLGNMPQAIASYQKAIEIRPDFAAAHSNLAGTLREQGNNQGAISHYLLAVQYDPHFADAYSNMGNAYKDLGNFEEAKRCYNKAIELNPQHGDAYSNLAATLKDESNLPGAIKNYRKALSINPNAPDAVANLAHTLMFICDWSTRDADFKHLSQILDQQMQQPSQTPCVQPFHSLVLPLSQKEMLQIASRFAAKARTSVALALSQMPKGGFDHSYHNEASLSSLFMSAPAALQQQQKQQQQQQQRIRVGYVSSDFGNHPLSQLMKSVFGFHDKRKFDIICYATTPHDGSEWRQKIEDEVETLKDISKLSNMDAAQMIYKDRCQILIDLNGYTKGARTEIFALQPAPVQMQYLGFCASMGASYIDYMIADSFVVPPSLCEYYSEKIISMPHSYFVNDHVQSARYMLDKAAESSFPTRATYGLPEDAFVFCNFNQLYKIDPVIFGVWMDVLHKVPHAILWLLKFPAIGADHILSEAEKKGVAKDRIVFSDLTSRDEHTKRGRLADLFVDTPNYNAHTTACDTLWGGVPIVTLAEKKLASRVAGSLVRATGLPELVVGSLDEYAALCVDLANDASKLAGYRKRLIDGREYSAAFDTKRWVRNVEKGLHAAWQLYLHGKAPQHIEIQDTDPVVLPMPGRHEEEEKTLHAEV